LSSNGLRRLLLPLVPLYAGVIRAKQSLLDRGVLKPGRLRHPVISVGSLSAGGAGKTPVVLMLAEQLAGAGYEVRILTRGYGRRSRTVQRVDPAGDAALFGDEPLLMARRLGPAASVWVGADRYLAGRLSERGDTDQTRAIYLLDDGFQHAKLARDLDVVLLTRQDLDDLLLPAGDLREPLSSMRRADVVVLREDEGFAGAISGKTTWFIRRSLELSGDETMPARPVAFCGLARPQGFFAMVAAKGVAAAATSAFRDHHAYGARDIHGLLELAKLHGADGFVTTEKDAVKLTGAMLDQLRSIGAVVVPALRVEMADGQAKVAQLIRQAEAKFSGKIS